MTSSSKHQKKIDREVPLHLPFIDPLGIFSRGFNSSIGEAKGEFEPIKNGHQTIPVKKDQ